MARDFFSYPFGNYNGPRSSKPFAHCGQKGTMVGYQVKWNTYKANGNALGTNFPNYAVRASLGFAPNTAPQQFIATSAYVDNEGTDFPVYLVFPDTGFVVACPPNASAWLPVFTNDNNFLIVALSMTDFSVVAATNVFITDIQMTPYLDEEIPTALPLLLGSTLIQRRRTVSPGLNTPALGDQIIRGTVQLDVLNNTAPLDAMGSWPNGTNLYVTCIFANVIGAAAPFAPAAFSFEAVDGGGGVARLIEFTSPLIDGPVFQGSGFNLRYDASLAFQLRTVSASANAGTGQMQATYSISTR